MKQVMERTVWIKACSVSDLAIGEIIEVPSAPLRIALYRLDDGFYATQNTCTHAVASLADGYLDNDLVECPLHAAKFCVRTGAVMSLPATKALAIFPVRVEDDDVYVGLADVADA